MIFGANRQKERTEVSPESKMYPDGLCLSVISQKCEMEKYIKGEKET